MSKVSQHTLKSIGSLVMGYKTALIDAHHHLCNSVWATSVGDVHYILGGKGYVVGVPKELEFGDDTGPITIKTNGIENFSRDIAVVARMIHDMVGRDNYASVTFHMFEADADAVSFGWHRDPADVIMVLLDGNSKMVKSRVGQVEAQEILTLGSVCMIPYMVEHTVVNIRPTVMLSIGLEPFTATHIEREG